LILKNKQGLLEKKEPMRLTSIVRIMKSFKVDLTYFYKKYVKWGQGREPKNNAVN